jgi:hypothetical protein
MAEFREVRVELRSANGSQQHAWIVEVDASAPPEQLLPDLVATLPVQGEEDDFELRIEGSLQKPVLVLVEKGRKRVGRYRDASTENG